MIQFNELRITEDNKCLIIDVQIQDSKYFEGAYIDTIRVDNQDTYVGDSASSESVLVYKSSDHSYTALNELGDNARHVRLEITKPLLDFCKNMFFVYVTVGVENAPNHGEAPCICSQDTEVAAVANLYPIYQNLMSGIREIAEDCTIPQNFINSFLQFQAVNTALEGGNYPLAIKYWNKFYKNTGPSPKVISKGCGCHGRG